MQNFLDRWGGCITKVLAVIFAAGYLIIIAFIPSSPYVWLSLTLVLMLCLTLFAYSRDTPIIRWRRRTACQSSTNNLTNQNENSEMTEVSAAIWMTDIPPSYSFVMETNAPVTPPPSYGSALLMFPWIATGQQSPNMSQLIENARFRSVSRQVSETSGIYINCNSSISRQTSRVDAVSTSLYNSPLSRQTSKQDGTPIARQFLSVSRQISQVTAMSRQISAISRQISVQEDKQNHQENTSLKTEDEENKNNRIRINVETVLSENESEDEEENEKNIPVKHPTDYNVSKD